MPEKPAEDDAEEGFTGTPPAMSLVEHHLFEPSEHPRGRTVENYRRGARDHPPHCRGQAAT